MRVERKKDTTNVLLAPRRLAKLGTNQKLNANAKTSTSDTRPSTISICWLHTNSFRPTNDWPSRCYI